MSQKKSINRARQAVLLMGFYGVMLFLFIGSIDLLRGFKIFLLFAPYIVAYQIFHYSPKIVLATSATYLVVAIILNPVLFAANFISIAFYLAMLILIALGYISLLNTARQKL